MPKNKHRWFCVGSCWEIPEDKSWHTLFVRIVRRHLPTITVDKLIILQKDLVAQKGGTIKYSRLRTAKRLSSQKFSMMWDMQTQTYI